MFSCAMAVESPPDRYAGVRDGNGRRKSRARGEPGRPRVSRDSGRRRLLRVPAPDRGGIVNVWFIDISVLDHIVPVPPASRVFSAGFGEGAG